MRRPSRLLLQSLVVLAACVTLLSLNVSPRVTPVASADILSAEDGRQWYRGNLHTHSLWSDGDDYLEMIASWYLDHDYDFLCFTDHNVLATSRDRWIDVAKKNTGKTALSELKERFPGDWVEERQKDDRHEVRLKTFDEVNARLAKPGEFLLIQGEEITDRFGNLPIHMNATNVQQLIPPLHGESVAETIQNNVSAVIAQRERTGQPMFIHLNHPNFGYGVTAEDLMRIRGEQFFEVYNGHPGVRNSGDELHASTERIWDIILTKRLAEFDLPVMYGLATDDGHNYHKIPSRGSEPGRGWVMVLSDKLNPASLIESMERGDFYASSGVSLDRVESTATELKVAVKVDTDVTYRIEFIGTRTGYDATSKAVIGGNNKEIRATRQYSDDIGEILQTVEGPTATYKMKGDEIYVRARITSSRKHPNPSEPGEFERAWVQPVVAAKQNTLQR